MLRPGTELGQYRILDKIGEGGMGLVYRAEHTGLGRTVALKVLRDEHSTDQELVDRFFHEARIVSRLGHRNIVAVSDSGVTPQGQSFFVMELLEGDSLHARVQREGAFPLPRAIHVALQLADALGACHQVGVVHRDLKPNNIMLVRHRGDLHFVKLFDFGIAKLIAGPRRTVTDPRSVMGTPLYMAPEQCLAGPDVDHRADIYALGVIMFEILTGRNPFVGKTWIEVVRMQIDAPFPSVLVACPGLPARFDRLLQRAVAKDREQRYQNVMQLRSDLIELVVSLVDDSRSEIELSKAEVPGPQDASEAPTPLGPGPDTDRVQTPIFEPD
jgi:serine/threonine-protein kinase